MAQEVQDYDSGASIRSMAIINLILGAWLIITPYWFGYVSGAAKWNQTILGIVVLVLAGIRALVPEQRWLSFLNGIAGIWAIIAPFILSYNRSVAYWNEVIVGIILAFLAFTNSTVASTHHPSHA